jgi:hypothetical protein
MKKASQACFAGLLVVLCSLGYSVSAFGQPIWGRLANPGFENEPIKSTYFFTGNCKDDSQYYEYPSGSNLPLYTVWPVDNRNLYWSVDTANRTFVINDLINSGINVVNMSDWGPRGTDNWSNWAPMQTSTYSHDELFTTALNKNILIAPYLESTAASLSDDPDYIFSKYFPGDLSNYDPRIIDFIEDLVDRYILHPDNPQWTAKWAQAYDQDGVARYVVSIIHVASDQPGVTDQTFAEGFDRLADSVYARTGVQVGFTLDILPDNIIIPGEFRANPETTGPYLRLQKSILAIECYIPEVFLAMENEPFITRWKHQFSSRWIHTGIPFIQDVSAGYDAHIVFPGSVIYGNNAEWREANGLIVTKLLSQGITFNTWNGYTEGYAGMPTVEYGSGTHEWVHDIFTGFVPGYSTHDIPGKIEAEDWSTMEGVQTDVTTDGYVGLYVGWMNEGDRVNYNVLIDKEALYYIDLRIAKPDATPAGTGQLQLNGNPFVTFSIHGTGDWQNWKTIRNKVSMPEGKNQLSLVVTAGEWNINWMNFKTDSVDTYYPIPGRVEAEDYYDMSGVVEEHSTDPTSDVSLGYLETNDWMEYYVDVQQAGTYYARFRLAQDAGLFDAEGELYSGNTLLCTFLAPNTSGWQNWTEVSREVYLYAGKQKLKIRVSKGPWNINWFEIEPPTAILGNSNTGNEFFTYPNPFTISSRIMVTIGEPGRVCLKIFDSAGRELEELYNGFLDPGEYHFTWAADKYREGFYYCTLTTPHCIQTIKAVKVK